MLDQQLVLQDDVERALELLVGDGGLGQDEGQHLAGARFQGGPVQNGFTYFGLRTRSVWKAKM
jgi:hypothetical protein